MTEKKHYALIKTNFYEKSCIPFAFKSVMKFYSCLIWNTASYRKLIFSMKINTWSYFDWTALHGSEPESSICSQSKNVTLTLKHFLKSIRKFSWTRKAFFLQNNISPETRNGREGKKLHVLIQWLKK